VLPIADDLGLDLGCYGNTVIKTPHIDGLAKRGTRFTRGFATVSSCGPSRASLYTGLHTHTSGQYGLAHAEHNQHTKANVKSPPSYLKAAGYRTGDDARGRTLHDEGGQVPPRKYRHERRTTRRLFASHRGRRPGRRPPT
jgi:arylsulfatase A-like enzyme